MADPDEEALFRTVWGEAASESEQGRVAVAWVVKNRSTKARTTLQHEASKQGQFDGYKNYKPPKPNNPVEQEASRAIRAIVKDVISGRRPDPTGGATFFHRQNVPPRAAGFGNLVKGKDGQEVFVPVASHIKIGSHYFFKGIRPYK
jgi:spore germination cell wall hydrolase CwlJ-like protein